MMRFSTLLRHPANWMSGHRGEHAVVLTSRIRLARNLAGIPFPGWAKKAQRQEALDALRPVIEQIACMKDGFSKTLDALTAEQKQVMVERHLISREHAARGEGSGVVIDRGQAVAVMVNEEDHLRIQIIRPGLDLSAAYEIIDAFDSEVAEAVDYAFDPGLGYLTTCPTNLGTGMRASAMVHLPALVLSDQIGQVLQAVGKIGLAVRGIFGEGTESLGNLFQISNQSTLGEEESTILQRLERVISQVASHERNARGKLLEDDPDMVCDKVGRAYGVLRHAWVIESKEALNHLSLIRLGCDLGLFPDEAAEICDELLMEIQPAHLQIRGGKKLSAEERDAIRAEIIRSRLQTLDAPDTSKLTKPESDDSDSPDLGIS